MFRYAEVEKAIAGLHGAQGQALMTFRSRIKHFQRIGLVPSAPGKGQKIAYTIGDAVQWALCFELAEFNLPPATIKTIMDRDGYRLRMYFTAKPLQAHPSFFWLAGEFLSWHLDRTGNVVGGKYGSAIVSSSDIAKVGKVLNEGQPRCILINLTSLKKRLGDALPYTWKLDPTAYDPDPRLTKPQPGDLAGPMPDHDA